MNREEFAEIWSKDDLVVVDSEDMKIILSEGKISYYDEDVKLTKEQIESLLSGKVIVVDICGEYSAVISLKED